MKKVIAILLGSLFIIGAVYALPNSGKKEEPKAAGFVSR